ncbi:NAD kinase [Klebsiella pneumoniae]|uniref:NAD kinase n=1 Tax=Klebsiella pneumoniae TaxID=573 RepID=A0A378ACS7_KLEPN|nr:NAD kinase [Klebsiella pneumoniae]
MGISFRVSREADRLSLFHLTQGHPDHEEHFKCIGIVGHPRHPTALTTHEMLWRWLCSKGYEVLVEQQIAHELQLSNVKTGTLAEIGQQADLAVVVGGDGNMLGAARTLARYDINVIGINRGNLAFSPTLTRTTPCSSSPTCWKATTSPEKRFLLEAQVCQQDARNVSAPPSTKWCCTPAKWRI